MISTLGKDENGRYWFKSDQYLTDITEATFFYVKKWWWQKKYRLKARFWKTHWSYDEIHCKWFKNGLDKDDKIIGLYTSEQHASMALEEVMRIRLNIQPIATIP